jgi:DNA-binding transcriptional MerR regulator
MSASSDASELPPPLPPEAAAPAALPEDRIARHRSGAVARMLRMPVATLRVWERRYGVTRPQQTATGQRLYTAEDVRRLALIKQLTDLGHAIGGLAGLDMAQLQQVAATHARALAARSLPPPPAPAAGPAPEATGADSTTVLAVVLGSALWPRLQRPSLRQRLPEAVEWVGPFESLADAAQALGTRRPSHLLLHLPRLHTDSVRSALQAVPAWAGLPCAVVYRLAAETTCAALDRSGTALLREPPGDTALAQWLRGWLAPPALAAHRPEPDAAPPRRWDDAALADVAALSSTIACECPSHVAELLMQLSHFEAYSAECRHRDPADAALHGYLQQVAASARARFEAALEQVAVHEGLILPPAREGSVPASP